MVNYCLSSIRNCDRIFVLDKGQLVEAGYRRSPLEKVNGEVYLRKATLCYSDAGNEVLCRLDLHIQAGEVDATPLSSAEWTGLVDGVDLTLADPVMLRCQIGVVLQDGLTTS